MQVRILKGLPASGKSTYAKSLVEQGWTRVNKDTIRAEAGITHSNGKWTPEFERDYVEPTRDHLIRVALARGEDVVVDDTNLASKHERQIRNIAEHYGAVVTVKWFRVSVDECIRRDSLREGAAHVGADVIKKMAKDFLGWREPVKVQFDETLPTVVLCDIDGTIAKSCGEIGCDCGLNHRNIYDGTRAHLDTPIAEVHEILRAMSARGYPIIYMSGRGEHDRDVSERFIQMHDLPFTALHMRAEGDNRRDSIVKSELFDAHIRGTYNVLFVLDDRDQVVEFWRSIGLRCLQVDYGDF